MRNTVATIIVAAALCGCSGSKGKGDDTGPSNEGGERTLDTVMQEWVELVDGGAEAMLSADDCSGRATALRSWFEANRDHALELRDELLAFPEEEMKAKGEAMMPDDGEVSQRIQAAQMECEEDEEFGEVWREVGEALDPERDDDARDD